jgi:hypothetical protein
MVRYHHFLRFFGFGRFGFLLSLTIDLKERTCEHRDICWRVGVPVPSAPLCLIDEIKAALLGKVSEVANEVCDGMFVACAAMFLENCNRFRSPSDVLSFFNHAHTADLGPRY